MRSIGKEGEVSDSKRKPELVLIVSDRRPSMRALSQALSRALLTGDRTEFESRIAQLQRRGVLRVVAPTEKQEENPCL